MDTPRVSLDQLQQLMLQIRPDDPLTVPFTMQSRFVEDLGMKSLELTGFVFACEQAFGVSLFERPGLLAKLLTVGATLHAIDQLQCGSYGVEPAAFDVAGASRVS